MLLQSTRKSKQILLLRPQVFIYFASHERSYLEIIEVRSPQRLSIRNYRGESSPQSLPCPVRWGQEEFKQ